MTGSICRNVLVAIGMIAAPVALNAQGTVMITGHVADSSGTPLPAAVVHVVGTQLGAASNGDGAYAIGNVPPGTYRVLAIARGYLADTQSVTITSGAAAEQNFRLRVNVLAQLAQIVVTGSPRLAENEGGRARLDARRAQHQVRRIRR